jgi:hypothetical protein
MTNELRRVLETAKVEHDRLKATGQIVPSVFHRNGKPIFHFRKAWETACQSGRVSRSSTARPSTDGCPKPRSCRVPERVAMMMTGHKTRSVFERYNIVSDTDLRDAARRLDARVG